ncbi:hypothetical protein BDF21DRAFT_467096 [Thamnidium elegans]|nr:hypothetical protein BDF21DRAFT_467096 [Thamnidium elegans]
MRILIDYKDEEFDLVCGEACHQDANDLKSNSGNSKLIQEGKEIQRNLAHIFYHYHVAVPQFEISFSGGFSVMDEVNCNFIGSLFAFRTSAEKSQQKSPEPTWSTPPRRDRFVSRIPAYEAFDSNETFYFDDATDENGNVDIFGQPDEFSFVKYNDRWFNVNTEDYANQVLQYLESSVKRRSKRRLDSQTELNSEAKVLLKKKKEFIRIETTMDNLSESSKSVYGNASSFSSPSVTAVSSDATDVSFGITAVSSGATTATTSFSETSDVAGLSSTTSTSPNINIRDTIRDAAVILHGKVLVVEDKPATSEVSEKEVVAVVAPEDTAVIPKETSVASEETAVTLGEEKEEALP